MIALGGKFKKIKATPIAVDKRLALALRLELQIPLLIIALYLPSRYYNKNRTPSTTTSPSSSSSPQHDPNAFTTASEYAFNNYGRSNEFRIVILNKILQVIEANPDCRVIIAGDLNTNLPITDTRKEMKAFEKLKLKGIISARCMLDPENKLIHSQPMWTNRSHRRIDHILMSSALNPHGIKANQLTFTDHSSLSVKFDLPDRIQVLNPKFNPCWDDFEYNLEATVIPTCDIIDEDIELVQDKVVEIARNCTRKSKKRVCSSHPSYQFLVRLLKFCLKLARTPFRRIITDSNIIGH